MDTNETEQLLRKVLAALEHGVPLDWADVRVYVVIAVACGIGSLIGAYAQAFFSKRGEIAAIKKDLDYITKIQEHIKASISGQLWIDQNFWNLKREVYWKLTSTLSQMSSALWDLLHHGFLPDRSGPNPDRSLSGPLALRVTESLDDLLSLTAPSHIVLCDAAVALLKELGASFGERTREIASGVASYQVVEGLRQVVDSTFDRVIAVAKQDLRRPVLSVENSTRSKSLLNTDAREEARGG